MDSFLVGAFTMGYWCHWCWRIGRVHMKHDSLGVLFACHAVFILSTKRPMQNMQHGPLLLVLMYGNMLLKNITPMFAMLAITVFTIGCTLVSILKYGDDAYYEWLTNLETKNTKV